MKKSEKMKIPFERSVKTYPLNKDGFYVDVDPGSEKDDFVNLYIYHIEYGIKELIIGIPKNHQWLNDIEPSIHQLVNDYDSINTYMDNYFDKQ